MPTVTQGPTSLAVKQTTNRPKRSVLSVLSGFLLGAERRVREELSSSKPPLVSLRIHLVSSVTFGIVNRSPYIIRISWFVNLIDC